MAEANVRMFDSQHSSGVRMGKVCWGVSSFVNRVLPRIAVLHDGQVVERELDKDSKQRFDSSQFYSGEYCQWDDEYSSRKFSREQP